MKKNIVDYYLAAALSGSVLAGFIMTRTVGMPGAMDDIGNWLEPVGLVSIVVEAFVVWNSLRAAQEIAAERNNQHRLTRNNVKDLTDSRA